MSRSQVSVNTRPVADNFSGPREKTIEFAAYREDVDEDGSFNTLLGGLITFTVVRANGDTVPEDKLVVHVKRTDKNVEVRWSKDDDSGISKPQPLL